jgi:hypothetical protein
MVDLPPGKTALMFALPVIRIVGEHRVSILDTQGHQLPIFLAQPASVTDAQYIVADLLETQSNCRREMFVDDDS